MHAHLWVCAWRHDLLHTACEFLIEKMGLFQSRRLVAPSRQASWASQDWRSRIYHVVVSFCGARFWVRIRRRRVFIFASAITNERRGWFCRLLFTICKHVHDCSNFISFVFSFLVLHDCGGKILANKKKQCSISKRTRLQEHDQMRFELSAWNVSSEWARQARPKQEEC